MFESSAEKVFESIMSTHQLSARVMNNMTRCGQWAAEAPQWNRGIFHLLSAGSCRVEASFLPAPIVLQSGDLLVVPRGKPHTLRDSAKNHPEASTEAADASILCGEFTCSGTKHNAVMDSLPDYFVVREPESAGHFRALGSMLLSQCSGTSFGDQLMLNKIADSLLVWAIRSHVSRNLPGNGLLAALNDPRLARALACMHDQPGRDWSIAELADAANLSRTAFFEHFSTVLGVTPMCYLRERRMAEALRMLRNSARSVAQIAEDLGYKTDAAFRRAFKDVHGFAPGQARQRADLEIA